MFLFSSYSSFETRNLPDDWVLEAKFIKITLRAGDSIISQFFPSSTEFEDTRNEISGERFFHVFIFKCYVCLYTMKTENRKVLIKGTDINAVKIWAEKNELILFLSFFHFFFFNVYYKGFYSADTWRKKKVLFPVITCFKFIQFWRDRGFISRFVFCKLRIKTEHTKMCWYWINFSFLFIVSS